MQAKSSPQPVIKIDFGDGEVVQLRIRGQVDFMHMLQSVGSAGVRRRGANTFPTHNSPLIRDILDVDQAHEYMVWPMTKK